MDSHIPLSHYVTAKISASPLPSLYQEKSRTTIDQEQTKRFDLFQRDTRAESVTADVKYRNAEDSAKTSMYKPKNTEEKELHILSSDEIGGGTIPDEMIATDGGNHSTTNQYLAGSIDLSTLVPFEESYHQSYMGGYHASSMTSATITLERRDDSSVLQPCRISGEFPEPIVAATHHPSPRERLGLGSHLRKSSEAPCEQWDFFLGSAEEDDDYTEASPVQPKSTGTRTMDVKGSSQRIEGVPRLSTLQSGS